MPKFELKPWNRGITNEEILEDLRRVAISLGKNSVSQSEYDKNGICRAHTVEVRLGGWNKALEMANLEVTRKQLTDEELFENLRKIWIQLGRQPTRADIKDRSMVDSKCSANVYSNRFGSWRKALELFVDWANRDEGESGTESEAKQGILVRSRVRAPSDRLRFRIYLRDNFKCQYCGKSPATHPNVIFHLDHRVPYSKGGESTFENLVTACSVCNLGKGDISSG